MYVYGNEAMFNSFGHPLQVWKHERLHESHNEQQRVVEQKNDARGKKRRP